MKFELANRPTLSALYPSVAAQLPQNAAGAAAALSEGAEAAAAALAALPAASPPPPRRTSPPPPPAAAPPQSYSPLSPASVCSLSPSRAAASRGHMRAASPAFSALRSASVAGSPSRGVSASVSVEDVASLRAAWSVVATMHGARPLSAVPPQPPPVPARKEGGGGGGWGVGGVAPPVAPQEGSGPWTCAACAVENAPSSISCTGCGQAKPLPPSSWACASCAAENDHTAIVCTGCGVAKPPPPSPWACVSCAAENDHAATACKGCGVAKPPPPSPWACASCATENNHAATACKGCGVAKPPPPSPWACASCTAENDHAATACTGCGLARPNATAPPSQDAEHEALMQLAASVAAGRRSPTGAPPPRTGRAQLHRSPCLALAPPLPPLPHARALQSAEPPRCPLRCPALRVRRHCHRARSSPVHGHRAARLLMRRLPSHTQWMWIMRCALLCAWRCTTAPLSLAWGRLARPPPRRLAAVQRMMAARSKAEAPAWHPRTPIFFLPH